MAYKLVIFDCDGTLIDTAVDVADCFNEALDSCGFPRVGFSVVSALIGKPLEVIVAGLIEAGGRKATEADVSRVALAYKDVYGRSDKPHTAPFPGMEQLVDDLLDNGVCVAINSNKPEPALVTLVERCFPGRDLLVTGYVAERPVKPDPAGALEVARACGVEPHEAVYVGDTVVDLETAANAGMDCIIMTWGQGTQDLYDRPELVACCSIADQLRVALAH